MDADVSDAPDADDDADDDAEAPEPKRTIREALSQRDSFGLLLLLVLIDYFALILVINPRWSGLAHAVPVAVTVLLALHTSGAWHRTVRLAQILVAVVLVLSVIEVFTYPKTTGAAGAGITALLLVISSLAVLRRVLRHRTVTVETLLGAISVYVMIGLTFAFAYISIGHLISTPFFYPGTYTSHPTTGDYVYFSFITLTTVGYGDFAPLSKVARSVVVLEALLGQVFLVTLVARLVSLYSASDRRERRRESLVDDQEWQSRQTSRFGGWFARSRPGAGDLEAEAHLDPWRLRRRRAGGQGSGPDTGSAVPDAGPEGAPSP